MSPNDTLFLQSTTQIIKDGKFILHLDSTPHQPVSVSEQIVKLISISYCAIFNSDEMVYC